jgi:hypothetical protein
LRSGLPAIDIVEALQHVHNRLLVKEKARPYTLTIGPAAVPEHRWMTRFPITLLHCDVLTI